MERLTKQGEGNRYYLTDDQLIVRDALGYTGEAIEKLAKFENIREQLQASQQTISEEMAVLKDQGKTNSVKFKELMVKKLTNSNILNLFNLHEV